MPPPCVVEAFDVGEHGGLQLSAGRSGTVVSDVRLRVLITTLSRALRRPVEPGLWAVDCRSGGSAGGRGVGDRAPSRARGRRARPEDGRPSTSPRSAGRNGRAPKPGTAILPDGRWVMSAHPSRSDASGLKSPCGQVGRDAHARDPHGVVGVSGGGCPQAPRLRSAARHASCALGCRNGG